ncbi:hypothetical protein CANARDRAFT_8421 [[Candida] arabinofermentans NRRL YB-2248]|uniref:Autophagy-related protein n=1 Tax=[Candida] arabinofermentans NRRL YB-2248 TaxID=983967 RepID=A0A1E4SZE3_9ASCO|nr:hypothetical protein CANARDRAFT_8421 [[Candida] arabinofermentans NRRL YB-2248]
MRSSDDTDAGVSLLDNYHNDDDVSSQSPLLEEEQFTSDIKQPSTTNLEILGWTIYAWAAEPFIVSVVGTYVPLLLEQIARDNGVQLSDKLTPCVGGSHDPNIPLPDPPSDSMLKYVRDNISVNGGEANTCVLPVLGGRFFIDPSSYALYTFSLSVLVQTIVVISMSGAADRGSHRKTLLLTFGVFGGLSTMMFWSVQNNGYYLASLLCILANSAFGCVNVCGNSFLSLLVNNHESVKRISKNDPLRLSKIGEVSSRISGYGAALGYVSALVVQILTMLVILKIRHNPNVDSLIYPIKVVIGIVGLWWLVFQVPLAILLKSRPSKELKIDHLKYPSPGDDQYLRKIIGYKYQIIKAYIWHGYRMLLLSIRLASQLKDISFFLLGWFIVSDSLTTINSTAILFAKSSLQMSTIELSQIGILTMISAIIGSIIIPSVIQPYFKLDIKRTMIYIIIWAAFIPFYGVAGFFFKGIGLHHKVEMYFLAIWYGFSLGGIATISRSLYSMLIPKGQESIFFALFSITDKGSSIIGPVLVGLIIDVTHDIRKCFWALLALLIAAVPVFWYGVDLDRGLREANILEAADDDLNDD